MTQNYWLNLHDENKSTARVPLTQYHIECQTFPVLLPTQDYRLFPCLAHSVLSLVCGSSAIIVLSLPGICAAETYNYLSLFRPAYYITGDLSELSRVCSTYVVEVGDSRGVINIDPYMTVTYNSSTLMCIFCSGSPYKLPKLKLKNMW